jgi:hypothetical protein
VPRGYPVRLDKSAGETKANMIGSHAVALRTCTATCHRLTVQQIRRWCEGVAASPDETLRKRRLKQLLA